MPWIPGQASLEDRESRFPSCDAVPTVRCEDLSPESFRAEFMAKNLPVMITGLTDDWRARREWVTKDGQPDVVAMSELFGDAKVLVVDCDEEIDTDLKRREMPFREFARWWRSSATGKRASAGADAREKLYVKDWNFVRDFPAYRAYDTPPHVRDDWLNSSWSNEDDALCSSARGGDDDDDAEGLGTGRAANENENEEEKDEDDPNRLRPGSYRFVYCGVQGTWTPMHVDVARSFSWSVNVCGRKKWLMVPPSRAKRLRHRDGSGRLIPDVRAARLPAVRADYPDAARAAPIAVDQPPGALLFVPSCWAHQVHNETDCLSINHNWLNDCAFGASAAYLRRESRTLRAGLPDRDDRADGVLCQQLLARKAGINQLQLGALGACGLRRLVRELAGTESSSRGRVGVVEAKELLARLANVFEPLRHLVHETHFFAVRDVCEREYGERHHGPKFEEGLEFCPRAGTRGVGERVDVVVSVPSRESAAEETERRTRSDAFVESFDVDPWEENVHRLAEIVGILRRARDAVDRDRDDEPRAGREPP